MDKIKNKNWRIIDLTITCFLISLLLLGGIDDSNLGFGAAFFAATGLFLLTSNKMKDTLYFSKLMFWIANNIFKPKTRFNHLISGGLFIFVAIAILASGPTTPFEKGFFDDVRRTPGFWISIILVLLFNILIGIYTGRQKKQRDAKSDKDCIEIGRNT